MYFHPTYVLGPPDFDSSVLRCSVYKPFPSPFNARHRVGVARQHKYSLTEQHIPHPHCSVLVRYTYTYMLSGRELCLECRVSWVRVPPEAASSFFLGKVTALGVLCCFALLFV